MNNHQLILYLFDSLSTLLLVAKIGCGIFAILSVVFFIESYSKTLNTQEERDKHFKNFKLMLCFFFLSLLLVIFIPNKQTMNSFLTVEATEKKGV